MNARAEILVVGPPSVTPGQPSWRETQVDSCRRWTVAEIGRVQSSAGKSWPSRIQIVGILAFLQSLLFLVLWLWICGTAGAATPAKVEFSLELKPSNYDPIKERDPFAKAGTTKATATNSPAAATFVFRLDGILFEATNPSAIVNGKLLTLNKIVNLSGGNGQIQVKAVEIVRDRVVLEAGGKRVELQINGVKPARQQP